MLRAARPGLYRPEKINPALPAGTGYGDVDGGKGIGEIGITGTAAAIGNAVYHATGRRVRDLPITPAKLPGPGVASPARRAQC